MHADMDLQEGREKARATVKQALVKWAMSIGLVSELSRGLLVGDE